MQHIQINRHPNLACMHAIVVLFFSDSAMTFAQILSLANLNLPNHLGCLTISTNAPLNILLCISHLAGTISPVKCMSSFSLKLIVVDVKLVGPLTSSLALPVVFYLTIHAFSGFLQLLCSSSWTIQCYFHSHWMDVHLVVDDDGFVLSSNVGARAF